MRSVMIKMIRLMFLLETSGRTTLSARQACSVESGARRSGRKVVLLLTADIVNICHQSFLRSVSGQGVWGRMFD